MQKALSAQDALHRPRSVVTVPQTTRHLYLYQLDDLPAPQHHHTESKVLKSGLHCSTAGALGAAKENRGSALAAATSVRELEKQLNDQRVASARRIRLLEAQLQVPRAQGSTAARPLHPSQNALQECLLCFGG